MNLNVSEIITLIFLGYSFAFIIVLIILLIRRNFRELEHKTRLPYVKKSSLHLNKRERAFQSLKSSVKLNRLSDGIYFKNPVQDYKYSKYSKIPNQYVPFEYYTPGDTSTTRRTNLENPLKKAPIPQISQEDLLSTESSLKVKERVFKKKKPSELKIPPKKQMVEPSIILKSKEPVSEKEKPTNLKIPLLKHKALTSIILKRKESVIRKTTESTINHCRFCGEKLNSGANYCLTCGTKVK